MTVGEIIKRALMQLGEDIEDVEEYRELFLMYLNEGYEIATRQYLHPRKMIVVKTNEEGSTDLLCHVVRVCRAFDMCGHELSPALAADGRTVTGMQPGQTVRMVCEVRRDPLAGDNDIPEMPPEFHPALADYICYRHLLNGNMAKQSRGGAYQSAFFTAMGRMKPEGYGSVTGYRNLYTASDVHSRSGW